MLIVHQLSTSREDAADTSQTQTPPRTPTDIVDRDTGEHYDPEEPKISTGWTDPAASSTQLFGITEFTEKLYEAKPRIGNILTDTKSALYYYGDTVLQRKYATLTLIPSSIVISDSSITGDIRLGQTDIKASFEIVIMTSAGSDQHAAITIKQDSKIVLTFAGGLQNVTGKGFTIRQNNMTSLAVEIGGQETEAALQYITALGYTLSDLTITLRDHRSLFE